jgi:hypothetical protein
MGVYNPDPIQAIWLFAHVWVGSGNVDRTVGTFLLNVDARFPRLTEPVFDGLTLAAGAFAILNFTIKVPSTVEDTNYLGNCCLMQFNWHDIGRYLDRGVLYSPSLLEPPSTRMTKRSPKPWSKTNSAGTRESEQPRTIANGSCPATSAARRA